MSHYYELPLALAGMDGVPLTPKGHLPGLVSLLASKHRRTVGGNIPNLTRVDGFTADQLCRVQPDCARAHYSSDL
jgi:hypothetical protein